MVTKFSIKLYVESEDPPMDGRKASRECVVVQENTYVLLGKGERIPSFIKPHKAKFLVNEVYDRLPNYVNGANGKVLRDLMVVVEGGRLVILLFRGDELMLLPMEGFAKTLIADVGNLVRKGDAFAAVTTRKGEVHYLKPPQDGVVVFIDEITTAPSYVYYMLPVKRLKPRRPPDDTVNPQSQS